jgi:hypothetical protein
MKAINVWQQESKAVILIDKLLSSKKLSSTVMNAKTLAEEKEMKMSKK